MNNNYRNILLTALFALSITSCNNNNDSTNTSNSNITNTEESTASSNGSSQTSVSEETTKILPENYTFPTNKEIEINFYHTMGDNLQRVLDLYLDDFNEIYPNIKVLHRQIGTYDDISNQLVTEISSKKSDCDIAYCYPDHIAKYNKAKVVVDLNEFIYNQQTNADGTLTYGLNETQINDFVDAYWNEGYVIDDKTMHCLPFSKSTEVLYYDKTFFTKNNLTVPDHWFSEGDKDVSSMEYVCQKIKEIDPGSTPLGYDSSSNWFITMCEQMGSPYTSASEPHYLFDNAVNQAFVSTLKTWYLNGWVTTKDLYGAYTSGLFLADKNRSYMSIGSSAGATYQRPEKVNGVYPWEVGITTIPQMDEDNKKVIEQGPSVCILNTKNDVDKVVASWLLARFLTTNVEFQCQFSISSGYTPVLKSCSENEVYANLLKKADGGDNIALLSTTVCVAQKDYYFTSPAFIGSSEAREAVGDLLTSALSGKNDITVEAAFKKAIEECNKV